ncbi:hypothetical protein M2138_000170 [Dysgonomonadaceae bacterium PH5-43]|nr:hypothetical protein [Dysgonomonadaceae bacterium PH5-43]
MIMNEEKLKEKSKVFRRKFESQFLPQLSERDKIEVAFEAGARYGYNQAIDDVDILIDKHEEEVYIGVVEDILKLKN